MKVTNHKEPRRTQSNSKQPASSEEELERSDWF